MVTSPFSESGIALSAHFVLIIALHLYGLATTGLLIGSGGATRLVSLILAAGP
jgi:hypothetical protein